MKKTHSKFIPAFLNLNKITILLSRYENNVIAPIHIYDGTPELFTGVDAESNIICGYINGDRFFTRKQMINQHVNTNVHRTF